MKEYTSTVSSKGQVMIPAEVRQRLRIRPKDQITFLVDGDEIRLLPLAFTLETAYGSVPALSRPLDLKEMERIAKEEHIAEVIDEMNR